MRINLIWQIDSMLYLLLLLQLINSSFCLKCKLVSKRIEASHKEKIYIKRLNDDVERDKKTT